jgi:hypothetical protein
MARCCAGIWSFGGLLAIPPMRVCPGQKHIVFAPSFCLRRAGKDAPARCTNLAQLSRRETSLTQGENVERCQPFRRSRSRWRRQAAHAGDLAAYCGNAGACEVPISYAFPSMKRASTTPASCLTARPCRAGVARGSRPLPLAPATASAGYCARRKRPGRLHCPEA